MTLGPPEFQITTQLLFIKKSASDKRVSDKLRGSVTQAEEHRARKHVCRDCAPEDGTRVRKLFTTSQAREAQSNLSTKREAHHPSQTTTFFKPPFTTRTSGDKGICAFNSAAAKEEVRIKRFARLDGPSTEEGRHKNYPKP